MHETFRAMHRREMTLGMPTPWLGLLAAFAVLCLAARSPWLAVLDVPIFFVLREWAKEDEFYLEILWAYKQQADVYRA